jgi:hypothetical protein
MENQRSSTRDTRFDNHVRTNAPNDFLNGDDILGKLNDRPTKPGEVVRVFVGSSLENPLARSGMQPLVLALPLYVRGLLVFEIIEHVITSDYLHFFGWQGKRSLNP